jgi:hypothetical protein
MKENKKMPGYTGYKPRFLDDKVEIADGPKDNIKKRGNNLNKIPNDGKEYLQS